VRIIAGRWKGHRLKALKGRNVRPTTDRVREAWMSALGPTVHDAAVLDLFAGSGALGLEALSRGATSVTSVERARAALGVLRANVELLGAGDACSIVTDDVFRFLSRLEHPVDLALADPPYGTGSAARLVELFIETPFAKELWLEHPFREELPLPPGARTRRYGDTAITTLTRDS
jgi:16S rRNA (guanine966-N2)-methyltransferase